MCLPEGLEKARLVRWIDFSRIIATFVGCSVKTTDVNIFYLAFKGYIRFMTNVLYYKKTFCVGRENVPENGTPVLIASNHQNALNDALGILLRINDRKVHFIVRANVFLLGKAANKFLRSIGLLPAFRMSHEGLEAVGNNGATFRDSEKELVDGNTVVIYPEAGHQWIHHLGTYSFGYTRMAFEAAEMADFKKEVFILPACNHYSKYFDYKTSLMIRFGTPISLAPYYELYKVKPRTAQREVNKLVREQVSSMMLNVEDVEHYEIIDYLRTSEYADKFAAEQGVKKDDLPARLESDKKIVASLAAADTEKLYEDTGKVLDFIKKKKFEDISLAKKSSALSVVLRFIGLLLLSPLALACVWPSVPVWIIPRRLQQKTEDPMYCGSFLIAVTVLFTFPIFGLITLLAVGFGLSFLGAAISWPIAVAYVLLFPAIGMFEWTWCYWCRELFRDMRARKALRSEEGKSMMALRKDIFERMDKICKSE